MEHTFLLLAYNESPHLENCIQSLLSQTIPSIIKICTSTPNEHIKKLSTDYDLPLLINPHSDSIGADWNFALGQVTTSFFTLAHQDDIYFSDYSKTCLDIVKKYRNRHPIIIFNPSESGDKGMSSNVLLKKMVKSILLFPFYFRQSIDSSFWKKFILSFGNPVSCPGVFFNQNMIHDFSFDENLQYALDWKAWVDLSQKKGSFIYLSQPLHFHREHAGSATSNIAKEIISKEDYQILKDVWKSKIMAKIVHQVFSIIKA